MTVILWSVCIAAILAQTLFQTATVGFLSQLFLVGICATAGAIVQDFTKALFSYIAAMIIGIAIVFLLVMIPVLTGVVSGLGAEDLAAIWIAIIVQQMFPIPLLASFIGSVAGVGLAEYYWY